MTDVAELNLSSADVYRVLTPPTRPDQVGWLPSVQSFPDATLDVPDVAESDSVITLAGAADVLLSRLVMNQGKENFTQRMAKQEIEAGGAPASLGEHGRAINDLLFINQLKHLDDGDDEFLDLDLEECALAAVAKALANYVALAGDQKDIVLAFKGWAWQNLDRAKYATIPGGQKNDT